MTDAVLFSLDDLVGDQLQPVSYKWLARHFNVPYDTSKRILFQYLSKNREKLHATFLVSGWTKDSNPHHVVRLVEGRALEDAKSQLSVVTAMHVYSVQPAVTSSKDTLSLYNTDLSQSEELLRKMLGPAATTDLLGSKLSTVLCESAQRSTGAVQQGPEVVPEAVAQSAITKVAPAPVKPAAASPVKEAVKPPASKPAKKSVATARKQAAKAVTAKNVPPSGTEVKDVALKKEEGNGKRVIIDDSDSEDDVAPAAEAAPPPMKKVKQSAAATLDTDSKGRSKEKAAAAPEKGSQQASLLAKQSGTTKSRGAGAGGAKRKRRVEKTYFNDAGEEVTEMVEVTDDEAGEPSKAPSPKAKVNPASSPPGAVHKPAAGDQTKKSGKSSSAGAQRSIASFFSKK